MSSDEYSNEIAELALITPTNYSCKAWSYFIDTDVTGAKKQYGANTVNFPSFTKLDVLSGSGKTMKSVEAITRTECSTTSSATDIYLIGGTVKTSFFGKGENGQYVFLKQVDRTISSTPQLVLQKNQPKTVSLPTGLITPVEISSKLTSSQEIFFTTLQVTVDVNLKFSQSGKLFTTNSGSGIMKNGIPIKIYNPVKSPVPSTSTVVDLKQLSQSVFDLKDYKTRSLAFTAKGELPQWKSSEGIPYVKVIDPNGKTIGTFLMSYSKLLNSATNTYEFTTTNLVIPKSPLGIWKIEMHSNNDVRKLSATLPSTDIMIVKILDTTPIIVTPPIVVPPPIPTTQCMKLTSGQDICLGDDEFKSGGACYNFDLRQCVIILNQAISTPHIIPKTELGTASAFIGYKLTFDQGGIAKGIIPQDMSLSVDFEPLSFVAVPNQVAEKLQTVTLINSIDTSLLGASNISNLVVNTKFNILVDGNDAIGDIPLNSAQLKRLGVYTTAKDSYLMNQIVLNSADISRFLSGIELSDGQNITLQSVSDGTFDVTNTSGTHHGSFTGLTFTYDLQYTPDENFNPDPCKGLSVESLLSCRGGDPNNCVDFIAIQGDENCNTKEQQTGGSCQGLTSTECAKQGKNGGLEGITNNPLCDAFGIGCNPTGQGSDVVECPNGSFASKDTTGKSICLDNTKRTLVDPLNTITNIANGLDTQLIIIVFLVVLFIILMLMLVKRRRK